VQLQEEVSEQDERARLPEPQRERIDVDVLAPKRFAKTRWGSRAASFG
jgi:hypothetical protein